MEIDRNANPLTVTISGNTGSGKSTLAARIASFLRTEGIGLSVEFEDLEIVPERLEERASRAVEILQTRSIIVNMQQLQRGTERPAMTSSELVNMSLRDHRPK